MGSGRRLAKGQQHPQEVCVAGDHVVEAEAELQTLAAPCEAIGDPADGLVVMPTLLLCLWRLRLMCSLRNDVPLRAASRSPGIPCMD